MSIAVRKFPNQYSYSPMISSKTFIVFVVTFMIDLIDEHHIPANRLQKPEPYVFEPEKITVLEARYLILQE